MPQVLDEIREGILVTDDSDHIIYYNHEAGRMFPDVDWNDKQTVAEQVFQFMEARPEGFFLKNSFYKWQRSEIYDDNSRKAGILYM